MKKVYLFFIEVFWWLEHRQPESLAVYGYRHRKLWERRYFARFKENIYGEPL